jgi:hypothetical protein
MYTQLDKFKLLQLLKKIIKSEIDGIVDKVMDRYDEEIIPYGDIDDPVNPFECREEFKQFLRENLDENIKVVNNFVEIGIGDDTKLGIGDELDENTTDCIKIIGTILQGISGNYVLVTSQMTGGPEGRTGKAFIMPEKHYRSEAISKGWDPNKKVWGFSNFPGIPSFFSDLDLKAVVSRITKKFAEQVRRA